MKLTALFYTSLAIGSVISTALQGRDVDSDSSLTKRDMTLDDIYQEMELDESPENHKGSFHETHPPLNNRAIEHNSALSKRVPQAGTPYQPSESCVSRIHSSITLVDHSAMSFR